MTKHSEKLMVLGAGRGQVGLIMAAKALRVPTVVVTLAGSTGSAVAAADQLVFADLRDVDAIVRAACESSVTAIATSCTDMGLRALGRLCDLLDLPGLTADAAEYCVDKALMKRALVAAGVSTARHQKIANTEQLEEALVNVGLPLIIKATDLQGSNGIAIARDRGQVFDAFDHAMAATRRDYVIVEEFIEGDEFGAQALVHQGKVKFVLPHNDEVFMARTAVPVLHSVPYMGSRVVKNKAISEAEAAIHALGLDNCAVNIDFIARGNEVFVIELSGRVGANGLPEMVSRHLGLDYYEAIVRLALGQDPGPFHTRGTHPAVAVKMLTAPELHGSLGSVRVDQSAVPEAEYTVFCGPGDSISGFSHSGDCLGQVLVSAPSLQEASEKLALAEASVDFRLRGDDR